MERVGVGRAKLLLFGEHAAVYGFPSIGLGLPASIEIRVSSSREKGWRFPDLSEEEGLRFGDFLARASGILPAIAGGGGEIRISSTIPRALGFGSSAALCVALAQSFAAEGSPPAEIWSIAHRAEAYFHGKASGVDTGMSLFGGLRSFRSSARGLPETRLLRGIPLHLVVGAVPRRDSTAALVAELYTQIGSGDKGPGALVEELGGIADRAIALIEGTGAEYSDSMAGLGALLGAAHERLGQLGLGDAGIDRLISAGLETGAAGGKQSGAGSGGAFFLAYPSEISARASGLSLAELARREGIGLAAPLQVFNSP
jgi:mevalonate kinase